MSAVEFDEWRGFAHLYGPLTAAERLEYMLASSMALQVNLVTTGKRYTALDFLPRWDSKAQAPEPETSPADLIAAIQSYKKKPRRKDRTRKEPD